MSIPKDSFDKVKSQIKSAERILVCSGTKASIDTYSAMIAFVLYLQDLKKQVSIVIDGKLPSRYARLFRQADLEYKSEIESASYIVSIDHSGGEIEKVSYDDKNGKFNLYITPSPSGKTFDFENVDFKYGGGNYDTVFVFGVRSLNWLGSLYRKNKSTFNDCFVVNINNIKGVQDFGKIRLVDTEISVCEILIQLLNGESTVSTEKIYKMLLMGIVDYLQPMQINDYKISTIERMTSAIKFGADLKEVFQNLYFKRGIKYFRVVQRLFTNLKVDENSGLAWSGLSAFDLSQSQAGTNDMPLNGRIPFNICEKFKAAFVMYEVHDNEVWVEFEVNESSLDAKNILRAFSPMGNSARVVFTVKDRSMLEVENEILATLKNSLGLERISYKTGDFLAQDNISGQAPYLTETENDGNNVTAIDDGNEGAFIAPPPIVPSS